jgi:hypothetical protein
VFEVELDFFDRFCQHELIASHLEGLFVMIGFKVFIDGDNFLEIQFLEVNIQSADKEVDYISLLQLTASERTECFEDVADFPVETVE